MAKTELEVLYPTSKVVKLSVGEVTVSRFKLRQLTQAGEIITKLANCLDFDALLRGKTAAVDIPRLLYFVCEHDMDLLLRLFALSTGQPQEFFLDLEIAETFDLLGEVWAIALKPAFEEAGKTLKKNLIDDTGPTESLPSSDPVSVTKKSAT